MHKSSIKGLMAFGLAAALTALPAHLTAQEPEPMSGQCTAQLTPAQVSAGEQAVQVTVETSQQIDALTGIKDSESGISLASPEDLPRTEMAAGEPSPRPIQMGAGQNSWNVWLNLQDAQQGDHELTFETNQGECTGQITVQQN